MAISDFGARVDATDGINMEKRVLSWGGDGRREARDETVGPSLDEVWVVVMVGIERRLANVMSFCVVRTL